MTKDKLLKMQSNYYDKVSDWFIVELSKWSKKHNMYLMDYGILKFFPIDSTEDVVYEPYAHWNTPELNEEYLDALIDYEKLIDDLNKLGIQWFNGVEYSDRYKFIQ
jgi:hypothetical protein